jgi:hypothetical protein
MYIGNKCVYKFWILVFIEFPYKYLSHAWCFCANGGDKSHPQPDFFFAFGEMKLNTNMIKYKTYDPTPP